MHRVAKVHSKLMTSVNAEIESTKGPPSPRDFASNDMKMMASSTTKTSFQSNIGATSRRSKLGQEYPYVQNITNILHTLVFLIVVVTSIDVWKNLRNQVSWRWSADIVKGVASCFSTGARM